MAGEYMHTSDALFRDARRSIRKGKLFFRDSLRTRLHIPLTKDTHSVSIGSYEEIDRSVTANLAGTNLNRSTTEIEITDFRGRDDIPFTEISSPSFPAHLPMLDAGQRFNGMRLTMQDSGLCLLQGLVGIEVVDIIGLEPEHTRRFTTTCITGLKTHLGI